jgi:hypothetical protein
MRRITSAQRRKNKSIEQPTGEACDRHGGQNSRGHQRKGRQG